MPDLVLDLPTLRAWAEGKDPYSTIGAARSSSSCPVACYLAEQGAKDPRVDLLFSRWQDPDTDKVTLFTTEGWLASLIQHVDLLGKYGDNINTGVFLAILKQVEEESLCPAS
jgi:hypothetical protein